MRKLSLSEPRVPAYVRLTEDTKAQVNEVCNKEQITLQDYIEGLIVKDLTNRKLDGFNKIDKLTEELS